MSDTLVHSLTSMQKMLDNNAARVRREERRLIAEELTRHAAMFEAIGEEKTAKAFRLVASQWEALPVNAARVGVGRETGLRIMDEAGPLPDGTLLVTPEERKRMFDQAANDLAAQFKADEERIERDKQARAARGDTGDDSIAEDTSLAPMREHDDELAGLALVRGRLRPAPPTLD